MPTMRQPIEDYITQLARRLHLPAAESYAVLAEVHAHLEERAAAFRDAGVPDEEAERRSVQAFGPVRRISRELRASHPTAWGKRRWIVGIVTGAIATWALWLVGTVPVTIYYYNLYPVYQCQGQASTCYPGSPEAHPLPLLASPTLVGSSPLGHEAFFAYLRLGWLWMTPFLVLYLLLPFLWGHRAQRWWTPGLAYGLGTWLSAPWFVIELVSSDWAFSAEGRMIALALPLSLAASYAGWHWRQRLASASARAPVV